MSVCATITTEMATKFTDKFSSNSVVTLALKFQGQMLNYRCLKNACQICPKQKQCKEIGWFVSYMTLATDLACYLGHDFPSTKYLTWSQEGEFLGWIDILLIISDLRFAFVICCSAVQVWRFYRWQHQYDHITIATETVCIKDIIHAGVLFWVSFHRHTDHVWNWQNFR